MKFKLNINNIARLISGMIIAVFGVSIWKCTQSGPLTIPELFLLSGVFMVFLIEAIIYTINDTKVVIEK